MAEQPEQPSAVGELALWVLAGVFMSAMALMAVGTARYVLGWDDNQWIVASVAVGTLSLTWGSWASLLWTRSRVLKTLMVAVVVIPGIAMLLVGGWALFNVPENRWIWKWGWLIVALHGAGALAFSLYVCSRGLIGAEFVPELRGRRLAMGWTLFPMIVVGGSLAIVAAFFAWMPDVVAGGDGVAEVVARWTLPSQAVVLLTTVLPAGAAYLCHRLTLRDRDDRRPGR